VSVVKVLTVTHELPDQYWRVAFRAKEVERRPEKTEYSPTIGEVFATDRVVERVAAVAGAVSVRLNRAIAATIAQARDNRADLPRTGMPGFCQVVWPHLRADRTVAMPGDLSDSVPRGGMNPCPHST